MKHRFFTALLCVFTMQGCAVLPKFSDVFTSGKEGYKSIRIPSVVVTKKGEIGRAHV